ncbi:MAG: hypothetical protein L7S64_00870 [Longimicrobiales bacterium]|nr:hypothetical protein [Longimicrobiales bacterium]
MAEKKKNESTALQSVEPSGFAIVDQPQARETMLAAFDQLGITESLLQRIKLPLGGMTAFMVDDLDGQQVHQHIDVILVAIKGRQKAWWAKPLEDAGGGARPSCSSTDGMHGYGNNTLADDGPEGKHLCSECPWGKFGSNRGGGNGKDCKDFSVLFFFREGSRIPAVMQVPATSLKSLQNYVLRLIDNGKRFEGVVTRLGLKSAQSASGIAYSMLDVSYVKDLDAEQAETMVEIGKAFMARMQDYNAFEADGQG